MSSNPSWYVYALGGLGVLLSGTFAFAGGILGSRFERRLSFDERFWDERKELYVEIATVLSDIAKALAAASIDPWRGTKSYSFIRDRLNRLQESHGVKIARQVDQLGERSGQMRLLASPRVNDCFSAVMSTWSSLLDDITDVAYGVPIDRPGVYAKWSQTHREMLLVLISEMTSDLRSRKIGGAGRRDAYRTFRRITHASAIDEDGEDGHQS